MKYLFLTLFSLSAFASDFEVCTTNVGKNGNIMHCTEERNLIKAKKELREKGQKERDRLPTLEERKNIKTSRD